LVADAVLLAEGSDRGEHRRWAAGVDDCGGRVVAGEHRDQEVGYVALVAGVAVLAGEANIWAEGATGAEELIEAAGVLLIPEAEEDSERYSPFDELAAPDGHRGDADAAADEDGAGGVGVDLFRGRESVAERAGYPDLFSRLKLAEPMGARAYSLDEEVQTHTVF
jgi:hypothetical protein